MASLEEGEIFDVDKLEAQPKKKPQPAFQIYEGSKIAVSRATGKLWQTRYEAAMAAYDKIHESWEEVFAYYNNHQGKSKDTPRGTFKRGDATENVIFSNLNIMLPAVYSKNPDITCNTDDKEDEEFCRTLEAALMALFRKRDKLAAKGKIKKAAGFGLLTNFGTLKLDFVLKDDSREVVQEAIVEISKKLSEAKGTQEVEELYGQLSALEAQMEVSEQSGPTLKNLLPHYLLVDPYAELPDGTDGDWMMEYCLLPTEYLRARFTKKDEEGEEVLIFKPTHKAVLSKSDSDRETGLGLVLEATAVDSNTPQSFTDDERLSYLYTNMTECIYVWDKVTRREMLFLKDDWTWPIWVWDDRLNLSRFFPYFIMSFGLSTGGTVSVGETSYYLDQQDEINDINRQVAKIRRSVFDYYFYNSSLIKDDQAEAFFDALRGNTNAKKHVLGVRLDGDGDIKKAFFAFEPPSAQSEWLFNKGVIFESINRLTNTSDALRGVQFKTNTNEKAVETYQESAKLNVGAKVDVIEDTVADLAHALAEMCVQFYDAEDIAQLVSKERARHWRQMGVQEFNTSYNLEVVAGSTEKPNSAFRKKEAIEVTQAVGQFARGAPASSLMIMLKLLEQAFTEVVIKPEDWEMLQQEMTANLQKGVSTGGGAEGQPQQGQPPSNGQAQPSELDQLLAQAPPEIKQQIAQGLQSGQITPEQALQTLRQTGAQGNA